MGLGSLLSNLITKTFVHTNSQLVMPDPVSLGKINFLTNNHKEEFP
jgi:hypothetical protein